MLSSARTSHADAASERRARHGIAPTPRTHSISATHPSAAPSPPVTQRTAARRTAASIRGGLLPLLVIVFAVLNVGDLASTYVGLASGMREGNPLMSVLLANFGFGALILYKMLVIVAVAAGVLFLSIVHRRVAHATIWICNLLVLGVVVSNIVQFAQVR
jgi:uncharacterized integral membrane protein